MEPLCFKLTSFPPLGNNHQCTCVVFKPRSSESVGKLWKQNDPSVFVEWRHVFKKTTLTAESLSASQIWPFWISVSTTLYRPDSFGLKGLYKRLDAFNNGSTCYKTFDAFNNGSNSPPSEIRTLHPLHNIVFQGMLILKGEVKRFFPIP